MKRWLTLLLCLPSVSNAAEPPFDELLTAACQSWDVPGVAAVVVVEGKVLYLGGKGTKKHGDHSPVTGDTLFPLASCTKQFTSALLAGLIDDSKFQWDDPVTKHLLNFRLADPAADKLITIRDLLTHRSGLSGHDFLWYKAPWDLNETVRRMGRLPLDAPFRGEYHYSSLPYIAAGKAIEARMSKAWGELLIDRLGKPMGWKHVATTTVAAEKIEDRALGYDKSNGKLALMPEHVLKEENAAGSLFLSARDLGEWIKFQIADGMVNGKQLVSAKNLAETRRPHIPMKYEGEVKSIFPESTQVSYAMGWVVYDYRGHLVNAHGGTLDGFRAQITLLPKQKIGFALLNNRHDTKMNIALGNILLDRLLDLPKKDWHAYYQKVDADEEAAKRAALEKRNAARKADLKPILALEKYAGEYEHPAYGIAKILRDGDRLKMEWSSFQVPMEPWQAEQFRLMEGVFAEEMCEFAVDARAPKAFTWRGLVFERKK